MTLPTPINRLSTPLGITDPVLLRVLREHANQVNQLTEGRMLPSTLRSLPRHPAALGCRETP